MPSRNQKCACITNNQPRQHRPKGEQNRIDFLQTDLALCFILADLARIELGSGQRKAAQQALAKAETGYATVAVDIV